MMSQDKDEIQRTFSQQTRQKSAGGLSPGKDF